MIASFIPRATKWVNSSRENNKANPAIMYRPVGKGLSCVLMTLNIGNKARDLDVLSSQSNMHRKVHYAIKRWQS